MILGGVGLGTCSACNAPGAFYYPCTEPYHPWGTWMCDSCTHPTIVRARIGAHLSQLRAKTAT